MSGDIISLYRARLAREKGYVIKDRGGRVSVALAYPNHYRLGMSNLGFHTVYRQLNARPDVVAERVFLPDGQEMSLYRKAGKPLLSMETQTPIENFDLIAFSISFENDYPNILQILEMGRIPALASERQFLYPLVMAGGITTILNPEPLAPFIDFFLLGEAESNLDKFIDLFGDIKNSCSDKIEAEKILAENIPSLYVPSFYEPEYYSDGTLKEVSPKWGYIPEKIIPGRSRPEDFLKEQPKVSAITSSDTEFGEKILIELGRGCGHSCRFCAAGHVYRPPRVYREADLRTSIEIALRRCSNLGLIAAAVSDIPGIESLTDIILKKGGRFSVSSLRADGLTKELLTNLKDSGQKTLSIAPEAGSERLRRVINKHLSTEQIIDAVRMISEIEDFSLRLYFLIGIPTENFEDISQISELLKIIKHNMVKESASRGRIGQIKLSINCFVPKAFTPFQWFPMEDIASLREKQRWLNRALGKKGGIKAGFDVPKWAYVQALLSLGDRRVGAILHMSHKSGGDWSKAFRNSSINPDFYVYRPKGHDELLPWDFIDHGIQKKHLINEFKMALDSEESDICNVGECHRCGVCSQQQE
ncbi:MAG: radical SAM protein [Deltaproteobacteria bacterium]|nr:radical SAM protein [Deltaproteobacteria bacterium]